MDFRIHATPYYPMQKPLDSQNQIEHQGLESRTVVESLAGSLTPKHDTIAQETPIAFTYNGQSHAVMMATPLDLEDYALGFSLTERLIDSVDDIHDIEIRQAKHGITININVAPHCTERLQQQRRQLSGRSGCGVCGIADLAAAIPELPALSAIKPPSHQIIERAIEKFHQAQRLQQACGAVHCAALYDMAGEIVLLREDIGRHNALDKLIGAMQGIDLKAPEHFIVMSSRASHELIVKAAIAGTSSLVTLSAATSLAVDMAERLKLNLIGFIRGDRQLIYYRN